MSSNTHVHTCTHSCTLHIHTGARPHTGTLVSTLMCMHSQHVNTHSSIHTTVTHIYARTHTPLPIHTVATDAQAHALTHSHTQIQQMPPPGALPATVPPPLSDRPAIPSHSHQGGHQSQPCLLHSLLTVGLQGAPWNTESSPSFY